MSRTKNRKSRSLRLESLETRCLMAGDVAVHLDGGVLSIEGDAANNFVYVEQVGEESYRVHGFVNGTQPTLINGKDADFVAHRVKEIDASLGKGNDSFILEGAGSPEAILEGNLQVNTGEGNDFVLIQNFWTDGDLLVQTDPAKAVGHDDMYVHNTVAGGKFDLSMGGGADELYFSVSGYGWNVAYQGFRIDTGSGTAEGDNLSLDHLFTWGAMDIVMSEGDDTLEAQTLLAYNGHLTIQAGGGNDDLTLTDSNMNWQLTDFNTSVLIYGGGGDDTITVKNVAAKGDVRVYGSSGRDEVSLVNVHAKDRLFADLGSGDDRLTVESSSAAEAYLIGGWHDKGDDLDAADNDFDYLYTSGWEW